MTAKNNTSKRSRKVKNKDNNSSKNKTNHSDETKKLTKSEMKEEIKSQRTVIKILLAFVVISIIIIFGTKIFLYTNFLLGNDILINIELNNEEVDLLNGEIVSVNYETTVNTNPFCKTTCTFTHKDLSTGEIISNETDGIESLISKSNSINIDTKTWIGSGQKYFEVLASCVSSQSALCHTKETPVEKNMMLVVNHNLNQNQLNIQNKLSEKVIYKINKLNEMQKQNLEFQSNSKILNDNNKIDNFNELMFKSESYYNESVNLKESLLELSQEWKYQHLIEFDNKFTNIDSNIAILETSHNDLWNEAITLKNNHNQIYSEYISMYNLVSDFKTLNSNILEYQNDENINEIKKSYNSLVDDLNVYKNLHKRQLNQKTKLILLNEFNDKFSSLSNLTEFNNNEAIINSKNDLKNQQELYCNFYFDNTNQDLCDDLVNLSNPNLYEELELKFNNSINNDFVSINNKLNTYNQNKNIEEGNNISETVVFISKENLDTYWSIIEAEINNKVDLNEIKLNESTKISNAFITNLNINITSLEKYQLFNTELEQSNVNLIEDFFYNNITNTEKDSIMINYLLNNRIEVNLFDKTNLLNLDSINTTNILVTFNLDDLEVIEDINKIYPTVKDTCDFNSKKEECCLDYQCKDVKYPIIFVHGHAFNKQLPSEYSTNIFTKIQNKLEEFDVVNLGTISAYDQKSLNDKIWKDIPYQTSIKVSYYFDVYQDENQAIKIQTKSENIDTYAIRLREIVDAVKQRTGKDKVIIVAHSMGGLVSRRYIQLFSSDNVDKLFMFGTPNNGVEGQIKSLCAVTGSELECRDLAKNSLFLNKLNRDPLPNIEIHNVIGSGCEMDFSENGDGVVTVLSSRIDSENEYMINGTCAGIETLHNDLLNVEKYPEVVKVLTDSIV